MPNGMAHLIEVTFEYVLPTISFAESISITEGGELNIEADPEWKRMADIHWGYEYS